MMLTSRPMLPKFRYRITSAEMNTENGRILTMLAIRSASDPKHVDHPRGDVLFTDPSHPVVCFSQRSIFRDHVQVGGSIDVLVRGVTAQHVFRRRAAGE